MSATKTIRRPKRRYYSRFCARCGFERQHDHQVAQLCHDCYVQMTPTEREAWR